MNVIERAELKNQVVIMETLKRLLIKGCVDLYSQKQFDSYRNELDEKKFCKLIL